MKTVRIRVLGPVELHAQGGRVDLGPRRQRLVLAVLALNANRLVPVERLIELTWPDGAPRTAVHAIQVFISRLRSVLAALPIEDRDVEISTRGTAYMLRAQPECVDASRFLALLERSRVEDSDERRIELLGEALRLWSGPALSGAAAPEIRERLCHGLEQAQSAARRDLMQARLSRGEHAQLIPELQRLTREHPFDEQLHGQLMLALYRARRQADALAVYRRLREVLDAELGIEPSPAIRDLEGAILRQDPELSGGLSDGDKATSALVPAQLPACLPAFVGREDPLASLDALLREDVRLAVISGTAGVGKTTLALHWAHGVAARFPDGQLYVNLHGYGPTQPSLAPRIAIRGFLDAFAVPAERVPHDAQAQAALYRSLVAGRQMLIVLDNARDAEQVRPLLPGSASCRTIVTSRDRLTALIATEGAHQISLPLLSGEEARELLRRRLGAHRVDAELSEVDKVASDCAHLPLALAIVAAKAATQPRSRLTEVATGLNALYTGDAATDVRAAISWSYQALSPGAARLFRLIGQQPSAGMSATALAGVAGVPMASLFEALGELVDGHLIAETAAGRFTMHDLLRAFACEQPNEKLIAVRSITTRFAAVSARRTAW